MKLAIKKGATSKLLDILIQDSSSTTGAGLTGLVFNSAGLTAYYYREGAASAVAITLATMTLGTWATGGFVVIDGTNMPGCYQLSIPDAALATGANSVILLLKGATNMAPLPLELQLTDVDLHDAQRAGMTGLPSSGTLAVNPTLAAVTHAGAVIPTVTTLTGHTAQTGDSFARLGAPTGASVSADIAGVQADTDNIQTRLPAALVGGRVDASVGAYAAGQTPADSVLVTPANKLATNASNQADINMAQTVSAVTGAPTTTGGHLGLVKQFAKNKLSYNKTTDVEVLYEDDGTTAKWSHAMTDSASEATRGAGA